MDQRPSDATQSTTTTVLADQIIKDLLRLARQWVVMRFLVDEQFQQGGTVQLGSIEGQPFARHVALYSAISELANQGFIEWTPGLEGRYPSRLRVTPEGMQFVVRTIAQPHPGSIQQTINDCRCKSIEQLLAILEKIFHRLGDQIDQ